MLQRQLNAFFNNLSEQCRLLFRKYEKFTLKVIDAKKAIRFNTNCIREKLCPRGILKYGKTKLNWHAVENILMQRSRESSSRLKKYTESAEEAWNNFVTATNNETQEKAREIITHLEEHHTKCVDARLGKKLFLLNKGEVRNEDAFTLSICYLLM